MKFERNEHGHIVLTIHGLGLTGKQEIERLKAAGFRIDSWARSCLLSTKKSGYDQKHRLIAGKRYKIVLMPTWEIELEYYRTTKNLRRRGRRRYGYEKPLAGIMPRIREMVSNEQMRKMRFWHITAPHDTIKDSTGASSVLVANRNNGGPWLSTSWVHPDYRWSDWGAFAFLVPAN